MCDTTDPCQAYVKAKRQEWLAIEGLWKLACDKGLDWFLSLNSPCPVESILAFHVLATLHRLYTQPLKDLGEFKCLETLGILAHIDPLESWRILLDEVIAWDQDPLTFFQPLEILCGWILKERDPGHIARVLYSARFFSLKDTSRVVKSSHVIQALEYYADKPSELGKKRKV